MDIISRHLITTTQVFLSSSLVQKSTYTDCRVSGVQRRMLRSRGLLATALRHDQKDQHQNRGSNGVYVPSQDLPSAIGFGIRPDKNAGFKISVASVAI